MKLLILSNCTDCCCRLYFIKIIQNFTIFRFFGKFKVCHNQQQKYKVNFCRLSAMVQHILMYVGILQGSSLLCLRTIDIFIRLPMDISGSHLGIPFQTPQKSYAKFHHTMKIMDNFLLWQPKNYIVLGERGVPKFSLGWNPNICIFYIL